MGDPNQGRPSVPVESNSGEFDGLNNNFGTPGQNDFYDPLSGFPSGDQDNNDSDNGGDMGFQNMNSEEPVQSQDRNSVMNNDFGGAGGLEDIFGNLTTAQAPTPGAGQYQQPPQQQ